MQSKAATPEEYLAELPDDRREVMKKLMAVIKKNIPKGFALGMGYGMLGYSVPHKLYPAGYHCDPKQPLPFLGLANQKGAVTLYHMGLYADPVLLTWFKKEYSRQAKSKLDMGKSCIRFKRPDDIPYDLIGELCSKMSPADWITLYEKNMKRK